MAQHAVDFFETRFRCQVAAGEQALTPFGQLALPCLRDCDLGLGNLALKAARRRRRVTALSGSEILADSRKRFPAAGDTVKVLDTVIACKPPS